MKRRFLIFLLGLWECRGNCGLTYDSNPNSPCSRAYDAGRYLGWHIIGRTE